MKLNMRLLRNKRGFTLLEVLIVIVILGVIAGLALPVYTAQVEKARKAEALGVLSAIRSSEVRYFAQSSTYTTGGTGGTGTATGPLDFDFSGTALAAGGQTLHFTYAVESPTAATFTATATRNSANGGDGSSTVVIKETGVVTGSGKFA